MILNEDVFEVMPEVVGSEIELNELEPTPPETQEDNGIATMLIDSIQSTWSLVDNYNSIISTLTELERYDIIDIVSEIVNQESVHIGKLQNALEIVSPNAVNIEQGIIEQEELGESMKVKRNLNESYGHDIEIKAWIGNLGKYNEGELVGEWVEFPVTDEELEEVFERIGINDEYEETFVADYDSELPLYNMFGEYPNYDDLNDLAERLEDIDSYLLLAALEADSDVESALSDIEDGKLYLVDASNDEELGYHMIEEVDGGVEHLDRDTIERYFDFEALGRELDMDNYASQYDEEALEEMGTDYVTAGKFFCDDENASYSEIGEAYAEIVGGIEFVGNPENYFDYDAYGRDCSFDGTYTEYGFLFGR